MRIKIIEKKFSAFGHITSMELWVLLNIMSKILNDSLLESVNKSNLSMRVANHDRDA